MAEFQITFAARGILNKLTSLKLTSLKLTSLAAEEVSLEGGFKGDLVQLRESFVIIEELLRDVEYSQDRGAAVEKWVKDLQVICQDADVMLDEIAYEFLRRRVELHNQMKKKVLNFFSLSNPVVFWLKMAYKLKIINRSLVSLKNVAGPIGLVPRTADAIMESFIDRETYSLFKTNESYIIGREEDVFDIVRTLVSSNYNHEIDLSVLVLVGMPGLGKTTLAKLIYHQSEIDVHFHEKIWVCVSTSFEVEAILRGILEYLRPEEAAVRNLDVILALIRRVLNGKRYLLILDDVWNEDHGKWDVLRACLCKITDTSGSNIIVTTRSHKVAAIMETLPRHNLKKLSDLECWLILKNGAIPIGSAPIPEDQEKIGREIAKKCEGLPLVAKVLGRMCRSTTEWQSIQSSRIFDLVEAGERITMSLMLSFDNLKSSFLKQCFSYCSSWKKYSEIERDDLIQLWMAQGLLDHASSGADLEDIGNSYVDILLENHLLEHGGENNYGIITKCKMHNLVYEFAELISQSESWTIDPKSRHAAQNPISISERNVPRLRSLILDGEVPGNIILSRFRALRVLKLCEADIEELPMSISKLIQLRYLNVSRTEIRALPNSIGKLHNLQTLRMDHCRNLGRFPKEVQDLINLRHIYFDLVQHKKHICLGWYREFPIGIAQLTNLRTLPYFMVGKKIMGRGIEELAALNQLRGQLTIYDLEHVNDGEEAKKADLVSKINILNLTLVWGKERSPSNNNEEDVLEGLQPHSQLQILEIHNFMGAKFPSWIEPLGNLTKIQLLGCNVCEDVPVLGHLPCLSHLDIDKMNNLKHMGDHFYGLNHVCDKATTSSRETKALFPALKTLRISKTPHLIEWMEAPVMPTGNIMVFPCLEGLVLFECPQLRKVPSHFRSLRQLEISVCHELSSLPSMLEKCTTLQKLVIRSCDFLASLSTHGLTSLRKLEISSCGGLKTMDLHSGAVLHNPLKELSIKWCRSLEFIPIDHDMASLCELKIWNCDGLSNIGPLDHCTSLQVLQIRGCENLTSIPISQGLASLLELNIWNCGGLTGLPFGIQNCPSLQKLSLDCNGLPNLPDFRSFTSLCVLVISNCGGIMSGIESCTSLQELMISGFSSLETISFTRFLPSLRKLQVERCDELSCLRVLEYCPSLQELSVSECPKLASISFFTDLNPCHYLEELSIEDCDGLQSLPDLRNFTSLRVLNIAKCAGMESLVCEIHIPVSLKELRISGFHNLESIPSLEECRSLHQLGIWDCEKLMSQPTWGFKLGPFWEELDSFPDFQAPSQQLDKLQLHGWPKLKSLPQQVQHFTSLTSLAIKSFNGVEALPEWFGNLASLKHLIISDCANLKYLPSLQAMRRLTKLECLELYSCPILKERCTKDSGEEWPKISHIPNITFR